MGALRDDDTVAGVAHGDGSTAAVDPRSHPGPRSGTDSHSGPDASHDASHEASGDDAASTVVDLHDVVAVLGSFPVLAGVDLRVERGEILLLEGPNGAGKTSVLRLCAGLLPVARGRATVFGHDLSVDRQAVRPLVGLLGHRNGLYADLTVTENVRFWADTVGATGDEVAAAMARAGVDGRLADVAVRKLSAGQKRRTAIAALIARRARLWLLDEPHAGLDASGRDVLDATLREAAAAGATLLVASHELERAGGLATRRVRVVAGRVENPGLAPEAGDDGAS